MAVRLRLPGVGLEDPRRRKRDDGKQDGDPADRPTRDAHTRRCSHSRLLTILLDNLPTREAANGSSRVARNSTPCGAGLSIASALGGRVAYSPQAGGKNLG